jgi:hypothetical protein
MKFATIATTTLALFIAGALAIPFPLPADAVETALSADQVPAAPVDPATDAAAVDDTSNADLVDGVVDTADVALAASAAACHVPSTPNKAVAKAIRDRGRQRNVSHRLMLALMEAAWVESHVNNLNCGDRDSLGVFQQRPSAGWCSPKSLCLNIVHATDKFIDKAIRVARPSMTPGQLAQAVQVSAFPARYDQSKAKAESILASIGGF